ncbi:hypothetical protein [Variovorax sp. OV700]|uniref:hypothetical protein n=1 Tax=Variovorax sp. OV700 TaxID=1882826 RepID=UPI00088060C1|nr:hypothetical protein [Variovorax sp. OV700]SDJ66595.1 hypothetical protein SAMN05444748_1181 [Variovorax sp. OV700]
MISDDSLGPISFGIDATTCRPLEPPTNDVPALLRAAQREGEEAAGAPIPYNKTFDVSFEADPNSLQQCGWGLIFSAEEDPVPYLDALHPLIKLRKAEAGERFRVFSGADGWRTGESASKWLTRHGASLSMIDPSNGVPYYLAIVGPPTSVPFSFQYSLDIVGAVGRLDFGNLEGLRAYAESIEKFESDSSRTTRRSVDVFATCHDFDRATQLFTERVARPFCEGDKTRPPIGKSAGFSVNPILGSEATRKGLANAMTCNDGPPSIILTGSHGMAFDKQDPRLAAYQGSLVCQDWAGYGNIGASDWFAAEDVPVDARMHGAIHFFFACYGAGTPEFDNFNAPPGTKRCAPVAMTARLPQHLMTLPQGGVLATLGHIDKAWASSFLSSRGQAQTQGFRGVIGRLLAGYRVGAATDSFNSQWGVLSTELADLLTNREYGMKISDSELLSARIARDDCRNYVVLGDPAVRLRPSADNSGAFSSV